jgi:hypothetical protein
MWSEWIGYRSIPDGCSSGAQHPIPNYLVVLTQALSGLTQLGKVGTAVLKLEGRCLRLRGDCLSRSLESWSFFKRL